MITYNMIILYVQGGEDMATSSITKKFVIKNDEACDRLIEILNENSPKKEVNADFYEEGKRTLEQYFGR